MDIVNVLKNGGIAVIPTDTIYGIVGSALQPEVVEKIYKLRKRATNKPIIILISDLNDLNQFSIELTEKQREFLEKNWPNPLSVVLPISGGEFKYLHKGTNSLAFRMPKDEKLLEILRNTGPLVAPSANFEGHKPSETIDEAKKYFGNSVDLYVDDRTIKSKASTIIKLNHDGSWDLLRQGDYKLV